MKCAGVDAGPPKEWMCEEPRPGGAGEGAGCGPESEAPAMAPAADESEVVKMVESLKSSSPDIAQMQSPR